MADELLHHGRVVMRCDASVWQAPGGGLGQAAPLCITHPAIGFIDQSEKCFQFSHRVKRGRAASVLTDAGNGRWRQSRGVVVEREALDACRHGRLEQARGAHRANRASHGGTHPVRTLNAQLVKQLRRDAGVKRQAVFLLGALAPLAQAPANHVRANHTVMRAQVLGQLIHVAPGARQTMPRHHHRRVGSAPLGIVNFQTGAGDEMGTWGHCVLLHAQDCRLRARSRPTTPEGK